MTTFKHIKPFTGIKNYCLVAEPAVQCPTGRMGALYFCFAQPHHGIHIISYGMVDLHLSFQGFRKFFELMVLWDCFCVVYELEGNLACFSVAILFP